jgi:flagellin-like hook-associated protein FlgL
MALVGEVNRIGSKTEFNEEAINGLKNFQVGANAGQSMSVFIGLSSAYSGSVFAQSAQDYDIGDDFIEVSGLSKVGPFEFGDMVLISEKSYFVQGVGNTQTNDDGTFSQTISLNNGEGTSGLLTPVTQEFELISAFGTIGDNNVYTSGGRNSLFRIDLATNPSEAVAAIDEAMRVLVSMRASIGAAQNRINYTVSNLMSVSEQTTAARSRIEDADFAAESAVLAKTQVLQLTATAMLAQANAKPQLVLELIR